MQNQEPKEQPSTYFVADRSNQQELTRVLIQDQMLTAGMGGVLPEQADPARFGSVLDIGCGTGGWLIAVAQEYPAVSKLVGIDISTRIVTYARQQAEAHHLADRVQFREMDTLRMLEFPPSSFDLVNERFGWSYLRSWDWPKLLIEMQRIARPGAILRLTESNIVESNSPALTQLSNILLQTVYAAGHFSEPDSNNVLHRLPLLLSQHSLLNPQTRQYILTYQPGTPAGESFYEDIRHAYRNFLPFFQKWTRVPDNYDEIYQQALQEMRQPSFEATWTLLTAWGTVPPKKRKTMRAGD